jgi:hypothetical protein
MGQGPAPSSEAMLPPRLRGSSESSSANADRSTPHCGALGSARATSGNQKRDPSGPWKGAPSGIPLRNRGRPGPTRSRGRAPLSALTGRGGRVMLSASSHRNRAKQIMRRQTWPTPPRRAAEAHGRSLAGAIENARTGACCAHTGSAAGVGPPPGSRFGDALSGSRQPRLNGGYRSVISTNAYAVTRFPHRRTPSTKWNRPSG